MKKPDQSLCKETLARLYAGIVERSPLFSEET